MRRFYYDMVAGEYQCDVSHGPSLVYHNSAAADPCGRLYDMRRAHSACNIFRCHKAIGTDTVFFDIEAWGGYRCCHIYISQRSFYMPAHSKPTDGQFVGTDRLHHIIHPSMGRCFSRILQVV